MFTETLPALTLTVDSDHARLSFGAFTLEISPWGDGGYHVEAHLASALAAVTPDTDWPRPLAEFELAAPPS
jgi:hypothetical protein